MIPFHCARRDKTNTPVVYNTEIWDYAEQLVGDYKPSLLKEPGKLNAIHFLESYLGANVEFQDIYYREGEPPIAGATVFNDDHILVFDREGMRVRTIQVTANTIIIDNATVEDGKEGYASFTELHEGGHFTMHPEVYRRDDDQVCLFAPVKEGTHVVCCRKTSMECAYRTGRGYSPEQIREHQANVFAAFAAMPRQTFVPYAQKLIRDAGFSNGVYVFDDRNGWEPYYYLDRICEQLSQTYGVSFTAAKIHLKELRLLITKREYEETRAQTAVCF